jgi:phage baseplate assembly protein W
MTQLAFPYHVDGRGRTADADAATHVRDLIQQVLFVTPGERVNSPSFGSGLLGLTFAPLGDALASATQLTVQAALQQWLGDLIQVQQLDVQAEDATLLVTVRYVVLETQAVEVVQFSSGG